MLRGLFTDRAAQRFAVNLVVAFLPAAVLGLAFDKAIKAHLFAPVPVACAFIVGAFVIIWAERRQKSRPETVRIASIDDMRWTDALKVGCAQALALFPGTSRSGATIIGGMLFGLSRVAATEFSFFLAIPTLFAATLLLAVEGRVADRLAIVAGFRRGIRRGVRLRIRLRALADPLRRAPRLRPVRLVPDRLRRRGAAHRVRRTREVGLTGRDARWIGPLCSVLGVLGFSFKAILIKLAYAWHPVDAVTLLTLRMLFAAPFFVAMAWWAGRRPDARPIARRDWRALVWLGFIGYYLGSLLDFMGLAYITAALERLVLYLYPTMVLLLSVALRGARVTQRQVAALALSYAGIAFVFAHDLTFGGDGARCGSAARWCSRARLPMRCTWSAPAT